MITKLKIYQSFLSLIFIVSASALFAQPLTGLDNDALSKKTLVIGKVSDNPKKHYRYLKPMVDYIVKNMGDLGVEEGRVLMARNNRQMINYLRQGKVDWVTETPFSAVEFQDKAGAEIFLRKWKKGVPQYHTVFFTRKDSGINKLEDLTGKTIAFEDPGSSSAFYIPAAVLIDKGLKLTQLATTRESPSDDMLGYVFSGEEVNTSVWVYKGLVSAGAFNNLDWDKNDHLPESYKTDLKIIHTTKSFPRAIELVNNKLADVYKKRLKKLLLNAHNDPEAKTVLRSYQKTLKFDEIDAEGMAGLNEARRLGEIVRRELD